MAELDEVKGINVGETYRNHKAAYEFSKAISEVTKIKLREQIEEAKVITIISDGSTDVSVQEIELVYVWICHQGRANTIFLSFQAVQKVDADGIFTALKKSLKDIGAECDLGQKVVAFAADGASVNTGAANGVIGKMRDTWSPCVLMVKGLAHHVELAMKDGLKHDNMYDKVITMLSNIYAFYHKSPLQRTGLRESF